jgi:single-stranded-DNA-specific exonuclease
LGLCLDFEVSKPELLTVQNLEALELLEPYGNDNPYPCLCIRDAQLSSLQSIGDGKHTRFRVSKSGTSFSCIYFSMHADELGVDDGDFVDVAFEPHINKFRDQVNVQLNIVDVRKAKKSIN